MLHQFSRNELSIGKEGLDRYRQTTVAVLGVGGVGSFAAEACARTGIGRIILIDKDEVDITNINRQLVAYLSTVGQKKADIMKERIADINPDCIVTKKRIRYEKSTTNEFDFAEYDYVVDAIDTVASKLLLAELCFRCGTKEIACMGTGNKLDSTAFRVADVFDTKVCPLAKVMRRELKKRGVTHLKVVYSEEEPLVPTQLEASAKRQTPGSVSFVPPVAGMILASVVINDLIK